MIVKLNLNKEQKELLKKILKKYENDQDQNTKEQAKELQNTIDTDEITAKQCGLISGMILQQAYYNRGNPKEYQKYKNLFDHIKDQTFSKETIQRELERRKQEQIKG